jgi:hypothetical protein
VRKSSTGTIDSRFKKRSLPDLLVRKFLTEYGYDHGPVVARAIVDDILATIDRYWPERVSPKTLVWLAVRREWQGRRKGLKPTDLVLVSLPMVTDNEIQLLMEPQLRRKLKARRAFNRARLVRWCFQTYEQGGVLTQLDLGLMSGMSEHYVAALIREYEKETGQIVPTRGTVHDIGGSVTHKAEVIRRWLRNESPAEIARALDHSQAAVDRYIGDFQRIRLLAQKVPVADVSTLTRLSPSLVREYVALLGEYEPALALYSDGDQEPDDPAGSDLPAAAATEPGGTPKPEVTTVPSRLKVDTEEPMVIMEQTQERFPLMHLPVGH